MDRLHPEAIELLAQMVNADAAAARDGLRDVPFKAVFLNNGTVLAHSRLAPSKAMEVSRRALLELRSAGLFEIANESPTAWVVFLVADAGDRLILATGRPSALVPPPPSSPSHVFVRRRALAFADPGTTFEGALLEALYAGEQRLSKAAVATRMGTTPKTLTGYINLGLIPPPPWEALARALSREGRSGRTE